MSLFKNLHGIPVLLIFAVFFLPCHMIVVGYYSFTLDVCVSVLHSFHRLSVFCFWMMSKNKIFTKLGVCNDIVEIWFGISVGQISSNFDSYLPKTCPYFHFRTIT